MPAEPDDSAYDVVLYDGMEHLIPAGEQYHLAAPDCECGPLWARSMLAAGMRREALLHRSMTLPRPL